MLNKSHCDTLSQNKKYLRGWRIGLRDRKETSMAAHNKIPRRRFFAGLGLVVAAGLAAKLSPHSNTPHETASGEPAGDSYRLSEHVKKYYRSATI
jgi:hypothetical protein